jgi:pyruvate-formate lyase-activating enzyme
MKSHGGFVSINYFVLPGFTDDEDEWKALRQFIQETRIDLIQMRNLNIDPEWYLRELNVPPDRKTLGIRQLMDRIRDQFPDTGLGYYNPCLDPEAL